MCNRVSSELRCHFAEFKEANIFINIISITSFPIIWYSIFFLHNSIIQIVLVSIRVIHVLIFHYFYFVSNCRKTLADVKSFDQDTVFVINQIVVYLIWNKCVDRDAILRVLELDEIAITQWIYIMCWRLVVRRK